MLEVGEVRRVYGNGKHNAFTDLVKWRKGYYLDLDGNLFLAEDPFRGAWLDGTLLNLPKGPGLAAEKVERTGGYEKEEDYV